MDSCLSAMAFEDVALKMRERGAVGFEVGARKGPSELRE
jgi:hypothetical protein